MASAQSSAPLSHGLYEPKSDFMSDFLRFSAMRTRE
jgi:hypothetical protein